jgi:predicted CXXCH cytochrome family protein
MKKRFMAGIFSAALFLIAAAAEAGWLMDVEAFHASVHGQLSCQECHADINTKKRHPDAGEVNKTLKDFFHPDQCTVCHEEVLGEIEDGSHGGETPSAWQRLDDCLECHSPHYQTSYAENAIKPDLKLPPAAKCSLCHEFQPALPEFAAEDQACLSCHRGSATDDPEAAAKIADLCFHCHASDQRATQESWFRYALIDLAEYRSTPHAAVACMVCHPRAAEFRHSDQGIGDCGQCHWPHDEKIAHDAHVIVTCGACHLNAVTPFRDVASGMIRWQKREHADRISRIHQIVRPQQDASCRACHAAGNALGAAAMVLPAKSIICLPCHTATFSVGDTTTILALFLFLAGLFGVGSIWLSGGEQNASPIKKILQALGAVVRSVFSQRLVVIVRSLIVDGLFQRRLFRVSKERWLLHGLIFYPFVFRFLWGLIGLIASLRWPQWPGTWAMVDKNHPLTAFLFDLSGLMVILGVSAMLIRRQQSRTADLPAGLPPADWPAYALLGGIMIVGFILEGMRMAMTGSPSGAPYAFMGDAISRMLAGAELTGLYGYVWYLHTMLTGAFVVYLPFSRMFHMIMAPAVLAMNAASAKHVAKQRRLFQKPSSLTDGKKRYLKK